jgi:pSer/pThr/pTyr-binding forkhead associated (FHA) protein
MEAGRHGSSLGNQGEMTEGTGSDQSSVEQWVVVRGCNLPLNEGGNSIGRDPLSHIRLDAAGVSRRHARIVVSNDSATIEDLGSKNGTRLGDSLLTGPVTLRDGDIIRVGPVSILYRASAAGMSTEMSARDDIPRQPGRSS